SADSQDALVDDRRLGALIRAVRVQRGWRQRDLAAAAGQSKSTVSRAELGRLDEVSVPAIRAIGAALDIRLEFAPWWRGGELERIVNAGHTAMHEVVAARFARLSGWATEAEVTFSIYGERGSIDLLAFHAASGSLLVVELKTEIPDPAGLVAQVDRYVRLARTVAAERGWVSGGGAAARGAAGGGGGGAAARGAAGGGGGAWGGVAAVSRWVIVAESSMNRRQVTRHQALLRNAFPTDGRAIDGWLADPRAPIACISFIGPHPGAPTQADTVPAARSGSQGARAASSGSRRLAAVRRVRPRPRRGSAGGAGSGDAGSGGAAP
ncbi:MAG: helix-turn-helix domain-containing protein, partial [Candidatus Limnocylindrales bacterium]